jgi:hypothetical protein
MDRNRKAPRLTIYLGEVPVEVFDTSEGYVLSQTSVTKAIEKHRSAVLQFLEGDSTEALQCKHFKCCKIQEISVEGAKSKIKVIPVDVATAFWRYWSKQKPIGKTKPAIAKSQKSIDLANGIIDACLAEAIERRADKGFNKKVSEEDYNYRQSIRHKRVQAFRAWTDIIKEKQEQEGYYGTPEGSTEFGILVRKVNLKLFNVPNFSYNRDNMTIEQQIDITGFENLLNKQYKKFPEKNINQLINDCLDFCC